jgi:hypothetical protein
VEYSVNLTRGYYVFVAKYLVPNTNNIRLIFPTEPYTCPFSPVFPDTNLNFQGCQSDPANQSVQTYQPNFPCEAYDYSKQLCIQCAYTHVLENGTCVLKVECPPRNYAHLGYCYPVDVSCGDFDPYTGACLSCADGKMVVSNGSCTFPVVPCGPREYSEKAVCVSFPQHCQDFHTLFKLCVTCDPGFLIKNGTCALQTLECGPSQYVFNLSCRDLPPHCSHFDPATTICSACQAGYTLSNNQCAPFYCPPGYYRQNNTNNCLPVSPLCDRYDSLSGDCLSCKWSGYSVRNGSCLMVTSSLAGCQEREKLGYGPCGEAALNCGKYNLLTNDCEECIAGWAMDFTGKCTLGSNVQCQADEVSVQGLCVQMPPNCIELDSIGLCVKCAGEFVVDQGQCFLKQKECPPGTYLDGGRCLAVVAGCTLNNPTTGQCLKCQNSQPAVEGLCCQPTEFAHNGQCLDKQWQSFYLLQQYQASNDNNPQCLAFHPTLKHCMMCN